jgi:hypothetical protein
MRRILLPFTLACLLVQPLAAATIDRQTLVQRHNVQVNQIDPEAALSVGNGEFAFTVDVTGLQSLGDLYYKEGIPLETLSTWAWHSWPNEEGLKLEDTYVPYPFYGRTIQYPAIQSSPAADYFRENPHPMPLGRIRFLLDGKALSPGSITDIDQSLDLWSGIISSEWKLDGTPVQVLTAVDAQADTLAVHVQSALLAEGRLTIEWAFPITYDTSIKNKPPLRWDRPHQHQTVVEAATEDAWLIHRSVT